MRSKGWTLGIILLASLALLTVAMALAASPAGATITGTPLPPYGNDWVIDQDTTVLGESIRLQGNISIEGGNTFRVKNSDIRINSTSPGEHGILVETNSSTGDGVMELDDCSFRADNEENGYYFEVYGGLKITKARLYNVENGLQIFSDNVDVVNMTMYAQGRYGIYIDRSDPKIHSSDIYVKGVLDTTVTGLRVLGDSSHLAAPDLNDLYFKLSVVEDVYSSSRYTYVRFRMTGMDCDYGQFTTLSGIEVAFEANADVFVNYTVNPYVRVYYYVYGYQFHGGTVLGTTDVMISNSTFHVDADTNAPSGYLYMYNYWRGFENRISSSGDSPDTFSGFTAMNQRMTWNTNKVFVERPYYYGRGFDWYPSSLATSLQTITVDGIVLDGIEVQELISIDNNKEHIFKNNVFNNNYISSYLKYYSYMNYDSTWIDNEFINNTMPSNYYFYIYRIYGTFTFRGNEFSRNSYYRVFYIYYNYGDVVFENNVFSLNSPTSTAADLFYIYYCQSPLEFSGNLWSGNSYRYFMYLYYPYYSLDFSGNTWTNETSTNWFMYTYYMQGNADLEFDSNYWLNNSYNGFLWSRGQAPLWTLEDNTWEGNAFGQRGIIWVYGDTYGGGWEITDNHFINNTGAGSYFKMYGLGYWGESVFLFERNVFFNNTATTATTGGLLYMYKTRQDYAVRNNVFENNTANCIVAYFDYQYYTSVYKNNLYFEDNEFYNNTGKGIVYSESSDDIISIRGNKGWGNEDYVVWIDHYKSYQYISSETDHSYVYCYGVPRGPLELVIEANNFSYNPGGGIWARVSQYDDYYYYYNPGQPNADIRVKKNMLYGNGPDGWSLALDNLYRKPTVKSNFLEGSSMGQFWGLVQNDPRADIFDIDIRGVYMDGGSEGKTAFGFNNIDAEIYDSMFVNFTSCFFARDCEVNVYWCGVPEASGETEGNGEIYVWNHLEIWVTWANASGVDSGIPAPGAVVAIQGANGAYFGALKTDNQGRLFDQEGDPMIVTPWTCVKGAMNAWSPFRITLLAQENVSTAHTVRLTQDYIDPNPLRLVLKDMFIPEVIISNPQDDTLVNMADVLHEGFLFEIGSGITVFEGRTDMMPEDEWVTLTQNVLWQHVFYGMTEGYHNVSVRAADLSGNWNTSTIEIIVDLTLPDLVVKLEYLNATEIPYDPLQGGYFVRDKEIAINGTYGDNFAHDGEIIIRINGRVIYIFPSRWGTIYERITLAQGINTLIVDATDTAGNRKSIRMYVSLDSFPPTMYIYNPLDNQRTANETLIVTGLTEPLTRLEMIVQASAGTNTYNTASMSDGTFAYPVTLFEGIQKVLVSAIDPAGNPTLIDLNVILDTTPPDYIINQPPEAYVVTKKTRYTIVGTMTFDPDADVYIWGQQVTNTGVFQREVVLQEGENVIDIVAIDEVGNERTRYVTIVRDTVSPILDVTAPEEDFIITNNPTIAFRGFVEGSMGVVIKHKSIRLPAELVDGSWESGEWKYDLELGPQDLEQDVEVIAFDLADNEDIMIVHIKLDIVPPSLAIDDVPDEVETPFVWINGTTDEGIPFVYVQGVPYSVIRGAFEIQWSLAAGENNLNVEVRDEAGNVANDLVPTTYYPPPPIKIEPEGEDTIWDDILSVMGIALLLVAIVVLVTAMFVVYSRRRR